MASDEHGSCPKCGEDFNGGRIWDHFYEEFQTTGYWMDADGRYTKKRRILAPEEAARVADDVAASYGADRNKGRWGKKIGLSNRDSVYAYMCPSCEYTWDRYTGEPIVLGSDEN